MKVTSKWKNCSKSRDNSSLSGWGLKTRMSPLDAMPHLVLASAAVMTGNDPDKCAQLPDTTGLKDEIVFQRVQHYGYDRAFTVPGSKLISVGDENGCSEVALKDAIGENTAAVAYLIQPESRQRGPVGDSR